MTRRIFTSSLCGLGLCLLVGCAPKNPCACPEWRLDSDHATCPQKRSTRLYLACSNITQNYEIELIRTWEGDRLYVNLLTFQVPCGALDIQVSVDEGPPLPYPVQVMEGGQRLLLGCEATTVIIEALWEEKPITLYLAGRKAKVQASHFPSLF